MAPRAPAASEDSSHEGTVLSGTSRTSGRSSSSYNTKTRGGGLHLSASSHSISNHHQVAKKKKKPIIRVVQVFAPKVVQTDANNFRTLVQKLTGKFTSDEAETEDQLLEEASINHTLKLESRNQNKKPETTISAHSPAVSSEVLNTQLEEHYDHPPILCRGFLQSELACGYSGWAINGDESTAYLPRLERIIEEGEGYFPANQCDEGINFLIRVDNRRLSTDCGSYYDHDSPRSSLDGGSSSGSSSGARRGSLKFDRENDHSVFSDELDSIERGFDSPYPFMGPDDQQSLFMSGLDTKLELNLLSPTW